MLGCFIHVIIGIFLNHGSFSKDLHETGSLKLKHTIRPRIDTQSNPFILQFQRGYFKILGKKLGFELIQIISR